MKTADATIDVPESAAARSSSSKGKGPAVVATALPPARWRKGVMIFDLFIRVSAMVAALAASGVMGNNQETLPFFTRFFQFQAQTNDIPTFMFFMISMAIVGGYLFLSIPFSIVCILRSRAAGPRILLLIFDVMALTLSTAAGSATAAIVYLAHNGNPSTNWFPICQQFGNFCQNASGSVVGSFVAAVLLAILVLFSAVSLRRI